MIALGTDPRCLALHRALADQTTSGEARHAAWVGAAQAIMELHGRECLGQVVATMSRFGWPAAAIAEALDVDSAFVDEHWIGPPSHDRRPRTKAEYEAYLRSERWGRVRQGALRRAQNRCQLCSATGRLEVHHRTYERLGEEHDEDLIVLCRVCHARHHDVLPEAC